MKGWDHLTVILQVNNATSVTGWTTTLKQASAVAGTGEKALAFTKNWVNAATGTSDTLVETAVTSSTFDTATTDNADLLYVMEVEAADLDQDNDFDCVRLDVTGASNTIAACIYILSRGRYSTGGTPSISAIID